MGALPTLPVDWVTLGTFLLTVSGLILSPGPDSLLILRYGLGAGKKAGMGAVAGVQAGLVGHTILALLGVSLLVLSTPWLFKTIAVLGAVYIGWIGLQGFQDGKLINLDKKMQGEVSRAFRDAALCNLLNPKAILVFLALFPNFIDTTRNDIPAQMVTLTGALIVMNTLWQSQLALLADVFRKGLTKPWVYKLVTRGTGAILIILAVVMVYENTWGAGV